MRRPRIGITTSLESGEQRISLDYVTAVEAAGGIPVIIPMLVDERKAENLVDVLDGLIVTGGPAITEGLIGALPDDIQEAEPLRIASDKLMVRKARDGDRPILGICYGMQLLNAIQGGTIYADVQAQVKGALVHSAVRGATDHSVSIEPRSGLSEVFGTDSLVVNTRHIQAIANLGRDLVASAYAPDGVIEALESGDGSFMGVQFHPEKMKNIRAPLFEYFVNQIQAHM